MRRSAQRGFVRGRPRHRSRQGRQDRRVPLPLRPPLPPSAPVSPAQGRVPRDAQLRRGGPSRSPPPARSPRYRRSSTTTCPSIGGGSRQTSRRRRRAMPTRLKLGTTVISARASTARAIGLRCCDGTRAPRLRPPMRSAAQPQRGRRCGAVPHRRAGQQDGHPSCLECRLIGHPRAAARLRGHLDHVSRADRRVLRLQDNPPRPVDLLDAVLETDAPSEHPDHEPVAAPAARRSGLGVLAGEDSRVPLCCVGEPRHVFKGVRCRPAGGDSGAIRAHGNMLVLK